MMLLVKTEFDKQLAESNPVTVLPALPPAPSSTAGSAHAVASTVTARPTSTASMPTTGAALYTFSNPVRLPTALFGNITVRRDI